MVLKTLLTKLNSRDAVIVYILGAIFGSIVYVTNLIEQKSMAEAELQMQKKYEKVITDNITLSIRCPE